MEKLKLEMPLFNSIIKDNKKPKNIILRLFFQSDPGGVRTPNPQSRNLIFYPVELRGQFILDL